MNSAYVLNFVATACPCRRSDGLIVGFKRRDFITLAQACFSLVKFYFRGSDLSVLQSEQIVTFKQTSNELCTNIHFSWPMQMGSVTV